MSEYNYSYNNGGGQPGTPPPVNTGYNVVDEGPVNPPPKKKKKKRHTVLRTLALFLMSLIVGGAAGIGGSILYLRHAESNVGSTTIYESESPLSPVDIANVPSGEVLTTAEIYAANVDRTVGIRVDAVTTNFWGMATNQAAAGSGFIISEDGYVVTNYHVINIEGATSVTVSLYSGDEYDATVVGVDETHDLAVLKIEATGLKPVVMGDSDALVVGDPVVAIGNPLGELTFSQTSGSVSALDRSVTLSTGITMKLIQTDTAINAGNSGGALFNQYGQVIGITNAKYSSSTSGTSVDNLCFAIPINQVKGLITQIIENGHVVQPYLGVSVRTVTEEVQQYGVPAGAYVESVVEDGPADKAGVLAGDVITAFNGKTISGQEDLVAVKNECAVGDTVTLKILRDGQEMELTATLTATPESAQDPVPSPTGGDQQQQQQQQGQGFGWPFDYWFR